MKLSDKRLPYLIIAALSFVLYANTIPYDYALDDKIVITKNKFTKQGISGIPEILTHDLFTGFYGRQKNLVAGGRYRPLSMITFAIEYELFGKNPHVSHFVNVVLYALCCILLLLVLNQLFPRLSNRQWYWTLPFVTAVIYVIHPLHTEVVANIKGRESILCLIGSLFAVYGVVRFYRDNAYGYLAAALWAFFLAFLSKETVITFLAVIPLTLYFFTSCSYKKMAAITTPFVGVTLIYFLIRWSILGSGSFQESHQLMNNPFVNATFSERYATIFLTLGLYLKLLFFPHPLTHDYYPKHIPIIDWGDARAIIPFLLYLVIGIIALRGLIKKRVYSYAILFYLITLSLFSNIVLSVGTFMNERFMFFPSIGGALFMGYILTEAAPARLKNLQTRKIVLGGIALLIGVGYSVKTVYRNTAWKNDSTLSLRDIETSSESAKANMFAGLSLLRRGKNMSPPAKQETLTQSIQYLRKSLRLHSTYFPPRPLLGFAYKYLGNYNKSIEWYRQALQMKPGHSNSKKSLRHIGQLCFDNGSHQTAIRSYKALLPYTKDTAQIYGQIGKVYGKGLQNFQKALQYLRPAYERAPTNQTILENYGIALALSGRTEQALQIFQEALEVAPEDVKILQNYGIALVQAAQPRKAIQMYQKALEVNPNNPRTLSLLGSTYQKIGQPQKARQYMRKARQLKAQQ